MAIICASLMCLRPLLVRFLPSVFQSTKISESRSKRTTNPSWANVVNSKLASKLRSGNNGVELHSEDDEGIQEQEKTIRVQKTWVTESSRAAEERIELQERGANGGPSLN
jgi:hypothetical protein